MACSHVVCPSRRQLITCVAMSRDVFVVCNTEENILFDTRTHNIVARLPNKANILAITCAVSPTTPSQVAIGNNDSTISIIDGAGCNSVIDLATQMFARINKCIHVSFLPDGQLLAFTVDYVGVFMWCAADGWQSLCSGTEQIHAVVAISHDCCFMATYSSRWIPVVCQIECNSGGMPTQITKPVRLTNEGYKTTHVVFNPVDSQVLAYDHVDANCDDIVNVVRVHDGTFTLLHQLGSSSTTSLAFSPCGRLLASGAWYNEVRLWDVATGARVRVPQEQRISGVGFGQSEQLILTSYDGRILVWPLCKWSERTHHLFCPDFRRRVVWVLCARARLAEKNMPYEIWRMIFEEMSY